MSGEGNCNNPDGNPNIAKYGELTRFGAERGPDPTEAVNTRNEDVGHPNSIRGSIRRLACLTQEEIKQMLDDPALTMAQRVALKKFSIAVQNGNVKAMKELEDSIDGKLVEKKIEVTTDSYADLLRQATDADRVK